VRCRIFSLLVGGGFRSFGPGSRIAPPIRTVGQSRIDIGSNVFIEAGCWLQTLQKGTLAIGDGSELAGSVTISAALEITIGRKVLIAQHVYIADHNHRSDNTSIPVVDQGIADIARVAIGDGAWLGQNVVVLPGVTIGRGAVIGANAVVTHSVPDHAVAVGVPAKVIRSRDGASL
jgi:acetyltransferase-like isoleucine patch superfamily enzyme